MGIQDVGTIGSWTQARLDRHISTMIGSRSSTAKSNESADTQLVHSSLTFSGGTYQSADTALTRPTTGVLWLNGSPLVTANTFSSALTPFLADVAYKTTNANPQVFSNQLSVTSTSGITTTNAGGNNSFRNFLAGGDTQPAFQVLGTGALSWGIGGSTAPDVSLARTATGAPSSGGKGLTTGNVYYATGTTGFVYTAATNNTAFASYLAAGDANPAFKIFTQGAMVWGAGGASGIDIELARIVNGPFGGTGSYLRLILGQGLGYGVGTGGTVTQLTSFNTGVTLNNPVGQITLFTSATTAGTISTFTVTNSVVGADDVVIVNWGAGTNAGLNLTVTRVASGAFDITIHAVSSLASSTRKINFAVIKGAIS